MHVPEKPPSNTQTFAFQFLHLCTDSLCVNTSLHTVKGTGTRVPCRNYPGFIYLLILVWYRYVSPCMLCRVVFAVVASVPTHVRFL